MGTENRGKRTEVSKGQTDEGNMNMRGGGQKAGGRKTENPAQ